MNEHQTATGLATVATESKAPKPRKRDLKNLMKRDGVWYFKKVVKGQRLFNGRKTPFSLETTDLAVAKSKRDAILKAANSAEIDRVVGFEVGADDYVVKPFSVRELVLRIRALLRRANRVEGEPSTIKFGRLKIDRDAHRAWVDDAEIGLTALEFRLLHAFVSRRGRVQTRDALLSDVWGIEADVTTRTVDTHVKRLREKLGDAGMYIETLRGVGYRFKDQPDEAAS